MAHLKPMNDCKSRVEALAAEVSKVQVDCHIFTEEEEKIAYPQGSWVEVMRGFLRRTQDHNHYDVPDDGKVHKHSHECLKCKKIFSHSHKKHQLWVSMRFPHHCGDCKDGFNREKSGTGNYADEGDVVVQSSKEFQYKDPETRNVISIRRRPKNTRPIRVEVADDATEETRKIAFRNVVVVYRQKYSNKKELILTEKGTTVNMTFGEFKALVNGIEDSRFNRKELADYVLKRAQHSKICEGRTKCKTCVFANTRYRDKKPRVIKEVPLDPAPKRYRDAQKASKKQAPEDLKNAGLSISEEYEQLYGIGAIMRGSLGDRNHDITEKFSRALGFPSENGYREEVVAQGPDPWAFLKEPVAQGPDPWAFLKEPVEKPNVVTWDPHNAGRDHMMYRPDSIQAATLAKEHEDFARTFDHMRSTVAPSYTPQRFEARSVAQSCVPVCSEADLKAESIQKWGGYYHPVTLQWIDAVVEYVDESGKGKIEEDSEEQLCEATVPTIGTENETDSMGYQFDEVTPPEWRVPSDAGFTLGKNVIKAHGPISVGKEDDTMEAHAGPARYIGVATFEECGLVTLYNDKFTTMGFAETESQIVTPLHGVKFQEGDFVEAFQSSNFFLSTVKKLTLLSGDLQRITLGDHKLKVVPQLPLPPGEWMAHLHCGTTRYRPLQVVQINSSQHYKFNDEHWFLANGIRYVCDVALGDSGATVIVDRKVVGVHVCGDSNGVAGVAAEYPVQSIFNVKSINRSEFVAHGFDAYTGETRHVGDVVDDCGMVHLLRDGNALMGFAENAYCVITPRHNSDIVVGILIVVSQADRTFVSHVDRIDLLSGDLQRIVLANHKLRFIDELPVPLGEGMVHFHQGTTRFRPLSIIDYNSSQHYTHGNNFWHVANGLRYMCDVEPGDSGAIVVKDRVVIGVHVCGDVSGILGVASEYPAKLYCGETFVAHSCEGEFTATQELRCVGF